MTLTTLNLPTEIPWERICVTRDMIATERRELPGKWRSSIAVFKYVPDEDYQSYEGREISYLKVVVTVCGYQAKDKEVEGKIVWNQLTTTDIKNVDELLSHYHPCTGAIVQVAVMPKGRQELSADDYPYLMDFQPKKRELYEVGTDTNESMSRSLEGLNIRKASGTTESVEALTINQGGGGSGKIFWGAIEASQSSSGQWGTRRISADEQTLARTTDQSRERREGQSHTTQLSQVYTLFDAYHQGTNRGVFFLQPRPHTLEEPSGFVTGPRKVEGIQEIFLVVNRKKDGPDYCVSVRLDTAHFVDKPILGEKKYDDVLKGAVNAQIPDMNDIRAKPIVDPVPGNRSIQCVKRIYEDQQDWVAPEGFTIDTSVHGGITEGPKVGDVTWGADPTARSVSLWCRAEGRACVEIVQTPTGEDHIPAPTYSSKDFAMGEITIHVRSLDATEVIGSSQVLMITTRGLDCCGPSDLIAVGDGMIWAGEVESLIMPKFYGKALAEGADTSRSRPPGTMSAREANIVSDAVRARMQKIALEPIDRYVTPFLETDLFAELLRAARAGDTGDRRRLRQPARQAVSPLVAAHIDRALGARAKQLTLAELTAFDADEFARVTGLAKPLARRLRLALIGLPLTDDEDLQPYRSSEAESPPSVETPLVIGLQPREARSLLARAGLALGEIEEADSSMPQDSIIGQEPRAGTPAQFGSAVKVTLASGLSVRLPQVVGLGLIEAACALRDAGLTREPLVRGASEGALRVIAMDPLPGTLVTPNTAVSLKLEHGH
jgi:PASTA domain